MTKYLLLCTITATIGVSLVGCDRNDNDTSAGNSKTRSAENTPTNVAAQSEQASHSNEPDVTNVRATSQASDTATPTTTPANTPASTNP